MPEITIDPKHARLQAFIAGKGIPKSDKPVTVEVSNMELTALMRKAKENGFTDLIKVKKADLKKAEKVQEEELEADGPVEPRDEKPSKETTADQELAEAEEEAPKRRRRV
jgi:hypothetical protein